MKKCLLIISLFFVLFAQDQPIEFESKVGTTIANFLKIGVGPRAVAMGSAFSAVANDASAVYWNPAGIIYVDRSDLFTGYMDWIMDLELHQVSFVRNHNNIGSFGISINTLKMDDIEVTTLSDPEGDGTYAGASDLVVGLTYARKLSAYFSLGVTLKTLYSQIANESAIGQAIDIGTLFTPGWKDLRIGMSLAHFGTKMNLDGRDLNIQTDIDPLINSDAAGEGRLKTQSWNLPTTFRLGIAMNIINNNKYTVLWALDGIHATDANESLGTGFELTAGPFALRSGLGLGYDQTRVSIGAGYSHATTTIIFNIDYGVMIIEPFGIIQTVSIGTNF
ncbi:MAG: PorV/PorQ family protein [Candidatus Marinimicrobia bacterium]|nr:PorV/PorQ family protein [Candidatus Neomarinimicrobiota bacterium]